MRTTFLATAAALASITATSAAWADELPALPAPAPAAAGDCRPSTHAGIDENDARTGAEIVCREIAARHGAGSYQVRFSKLGARVLLTVSSTNGELDERTVMMSSIDEVTVAGPRAVDALLNKKTLDDTETVKNVLAADATPPRTKTGQMGFNGGILGLMGANVLTGPAPGIDLGLLYRADRLAVGAGGRLAGGGSANTHLGTGSLTSGVRYYTLDSDIAPFAGAGVGISYLSVTRPSGQSSPSGGGFAAYAEGGVDALRTHRVGFTTAVRLDLPLYTVKDNGSSEYVLPVSLVIGMQFH
jgi:hypothetical protein